MTVVLTKCSSHHHTYVYHSLTDPREKSKCLAFSQFNILAFKFVFGFQFYSIWLSVLPCWLSPFLFGFQYYSSISLHFSFFGFLFAFCCVCIFPVLSACWTEYQPFQMLHIILVLNLCFILFGTIIDLFLIIINLVFIIIGLFLYYCDY